MVIQTLVVGLIVAACATYAVWTMLPQVVRKPLANQLLRLPLPQRWSSALRKASKGSSGCGCDGCDKVVKSATQAVVFHPRQRDR